MGTFTKLSAQLTKILTLNRRHTPKEKAPEGYEVVWQEGEAPQIEVPTGLPGVRAYCADPRHLRLNEADRIMRALYGDVDTGEDDDPWKAANDPSLDKIHGPASGRPIPPVIYGPHDPNYRKG
jgi:hypothetical protein